MVRIDGEIAIDRPVDEVFDFVADERNEPRYNPRILNVEKLTPGRIGQGTRFRAETTTMGQAAGIAIQYTAYQRPGGWRRRSTCRPPTSGESSPLTRLLVGPGWAGPGTCGCADGTGC
jgi:hypothetical protein